MSQVLGLLETHGLTPTLAAVDAMEKAGDVRVLQCELNDFYGVCTKITGTTAAVASAIAAGRAAAEPMGGQPVATVLPNADPRAVRAILSPAEYNPLIEQGVVFFPNYEPVRPPESVNESRMPQEKSPAVKESMMSQEKSPAALGLIETQGFTAVFEAIDTACKAANVEVVGKEKLGGGYVTVIVRGDLSAVTAAVEAGSAKVEGLGKLIAAHVLARPSPAVLSLLPKAT